MPTFAELAGAPPVDAIEGRSFRVVLDGGELAQTAPLYWEMHGDNHSAQAAREGRWKAVRSQPGGFDPDRPLELYDLEADPFETTDVSSRHPDIAAHMKTLLERRTASPLPQFNFPPPQGTLSKGP